MALPQFPLAQINLNLPGSDIKFNFTKPPLPANPPTADDVSTAARLKHQVLNEGSFFLPLFSPIHSTSTDDLGSTVPADVVEAICIYEAELIAARQLAMILLAAPSAAPQRTKCLYMLFILSCLLVPSSNHTRRSRSSGTVYSTNG